MTKGKKRDNDGARVIPLKDLIPRHDPKGGTARRRTVFGGGPAPPPEPAAPEGKKRPGRK